MMKNWEEASERFTQHSANGVKDFALYIEDQQPYMGGIFYWFDTPEEMLRALCEDLFGINAEMDQEEYAEFQLAMEKAEKIHRSGKGFSKRFIDLVNSVLVGYTLLFIGTYESLLTGRGRFATQYRQQFREDAPGDMESCGGGHRITAKEREAFADYATTYPWDR